MGSAQMYTTRNSHGQMEAVIIFPRDVNVRSVQAAVLNYANRIKRNGRETDLKVEVRPGNCLAFIDTDGKHAPARLLEKARASAEHVGFVVTIVAPPTIMPRARVYVESYNGQVRAVVQLTAGGYAQTFLNAALQASKDPSRPLHVYMVGRAVMLVDLRGPYQPSDLLSHVRHICASSNFEVEIVTPPK